MSNNRYIPEKVSSNLHASHFFECAWCCTRLTERHHIKEFSLGGTHTEENLILLCPNCHTEVHKKNGNIKSSDSLERKSTHFKGDRISGNLQFDVVNCKIKLGLSFFENFGSIVSFDGEKVISIDKLNNEYFLNCRFYNKSGDLIFWMSRNRYWSLSNFNISTAYKFIEITNTLEPSLKLKISQEEDYFCLQGSNYYKGKLISFDSEEIQFGSMKIQGSVTMVGNGENGIFNM